MIKILMIEDDPELAEILSEYLEQFGMEITSSSAKGTTISFRIPRTQEVSYVPAV